MSLNQEAHAENDQGYHQRIFNLKEKINLKGSHLDAFGWLMHFADGSFSNFEIAKKSGIDISIINEAIALMYQKELLELG